MKWMVIMSFVYLWAFKCFAASSSCSLCFFMPDFGIICCKRTVHQVSNFKKFSSPPGGIISHINKKQTRKQYQKDTNNCGGIFFITNNLVENADALTKSIHATTGMEIKKGEGKPILCLGDVMFVPSIANLHDYTRF